MMTVDDDGWFDGGKFLIVQLLMSIELLVFWAGGVLLLLR